MLRRMGHPGSIGVGSDGRAFHGSRRPMIPAGASLAAIGLAVLLGLPHEAGAFSRHPRPVLTPRPGMFLYASPDLPDPHFAHTVIVLVTSNDEGAMGIIINKPTTIPAADAVPDLNDDQGTLAPLYYGGPVDPTHIFIVLKDALPPAGALKVLDHVYMSWSRDVLDAAVKRDPSGKSLRIYSGYSGWGPGQLDMEISRGDWVLSDADPESIFSEDPGKVWPEIYNLKDKIEVRLRDPRPVPAGLGLPGTPPGFAGR
jgi:putative transcriptional regulator